MTDLCWRKADTGVNGRYSPKAVVDLAIWYATSTFPHAGVVMMRLEKRVAMVTGGSRGLGEGIVRALAAEGAQVWAIARNEHNLEELKAEVAGVQTLAMDISTNDAASRAFSSVTPDILVLNAGALPHLAPVHERTWEQFELNWDTDVKSTFHFGKRSPSVSDVSRKARSSRFPVVPQCLAHRPREGTPGRSELSGSCLNIFKRNPTDSTWESDLSWCSQNRSSELPNWAATPRLSTQNEPE